VNAQQTERFAARRLDEAQRELRRALETGDAARIVAASLQHNYARADLRRAVSAAAAANEAQRR
jgi:hypothetical protein